MIFVSLAATGKLQKNLQCRAGWRFGDCKASSRWFWCFHSAVDKKDDDDFSNFYKWINFNFKTYALCDSLFLALGVLSFGASGVTSCASIWILADAFMLDIRRDRRDGVSKTSDFVSKFASSLMTTLRLGVPGNQRTKRNRRNETKIEIDGPANLTFSITAVYFQNAPSFWRCHSIHFHATC